MTGPKLENALQGLQQAINELDQTIMDTADRLKAQETDLAKNAAADSGLSDNKLQADKLQADKLQADNLRAELNALRQMIHQAAALIGGKAEAGPPSNTDEVIH